MRTGWLLVTLLGCGPRPSLNDDPDRTWPSLDALDDEIALIMRQDDITGLAACIVVDGDVPWCGGYGQANPDTGALVYPSTPFLMASASKAVTAVAVMQAVEDGALDLDAPINDVLPFPVVHPDSPTIAITTRHLLTHTSGIRDNWGVLDAHYTDGDTTESLGDFLRSYLAGAENGPANWLDRGVGAATVYSNVGAALAGYVVEAATGTPFDDFCDARILEPLGMNAGWHLADLDVDTVAMPTVVRDGRVRTVPHYGFPDYPDGQLRADAYSMARFVAAIAEGGTLDGVRLLDAATVAEMVRPQHPTLDPDQGLLWYRWTLAGDEVIGHNGGEVGASTEILYRSADGVGLVVLMNAEGYGYTLADVERAMFAAARGL